MVEELAPSNRSGYYIPSDFKKSEIYHGNWIDFNKNGIMDPYENPDLPVDERVEDLLSKMTLEEKIAQLQSGQNINKHGTGNLSHPTRAYPPREGAIIANNLQRKAIEETRLGIPPIIHDECLHGCMVKFSTVFPQAIALAATWNPNLVYRVAKAIARETRARGIRQCLSPVVDIVRDVRAGRTEESYGEDPYLTSIMGAAFCRAMREEGIIATPKHFVANFVGEGGRDSNEIHFSERILREIYLPPYKACIEAGALSVMAAYNSLDGIPCSSNRWLLTEVLRNEWKFEGFVVSDYNSLIGILHHKHRTTHLSHFHNVSETPEEAAKLALSAGLDVELPGTCIYGEPLLKAVKNGLISQETVDNAVRRVLKAKFLIGLFDDPLVNPEEAQNICGSQEHVKLALQAAREAIVLLKNEKNVLPLDEEKINSIAILGPVADEIRLGGYSGIPPRAVTPLKGIKQMLKPNTKIYHVKGCPLNVGKYFPIYSEYLIPSDSSLGKHGLKGEYFDNPELSGQPVLVRLDRSVDFDWGLSSPDSRVMSENFSVRWTGKLLPPESGIYHIYVMSLGGYRLWLDGELVLDFWDAISTSVKEISVKLEAGRKYELKLEYCRRMAYASIRLSWTYEAETTRGIREAVEAAKKSDVAVIFVGIIEGEARDRAIIDLTEPQQALIEEVLKTGTPTVVVLVTGSAVTGDWIEKAPAIVQAWYPGQEGGRAIAEVLFGKYNPGGKIPFTWPIHVGQLPFYYSRKPTGRSYKYANMPGIPLFPFGHGLSYTQFQYSSLKVDVDKTDGKVYVSVTVKNIGDRKGDEVVQLYIRDVVASIARPIKELRGFKRITLKPGEDKMVRFTLDLKDMGFLDLNMKPTIEPGIFEVQIGSSSEDIHLKESIRIE